MGSLYVDRPQVHGMASSAEEHRVQIAKFIAELPLMFVGEVTLAAATSTTATVPYLTDEFELFLTPKDAAGAALTGVYAVASIDTITITHSLAAGTEKFSVLAVGPRERSL